MSIRRLFSFEDEKTPFILDVDKAVRAWNKLYPGDMIKTNDPASIATIQAKAETRAEKSFYLLSGATYGSSFVGMVHVLNITDTRSSQTMESVADGLEATFKVGAWFANATGGFGVTDSFSNSAKNLLSTQNIQSHCSLVTMGIIPSIKANDVKMAVQEFADKYLTDIRFSNYPLWIADYAHPDALVLPKAWKNTGHKIWQKKNNHAIGSHLTDFDVFFGKLEDLTKYCFSGIKMCTNLWRYP